MTLSGLPQRDLTLSLAARAGGLESAPASVRLKFQGATQQPAGDGAAKTASTVSLYALVVGVGKFKDESINGLAWAGKTLATSPPPWKSRKAGFTARSTCGFCPMRMPTTPRSSTG